MLSTRDVVCPRILLDQARGGSPVRTVVAGADSAPALESARLAAEAGLIEPILVGAEAAMRRQADRLGWDIGGCERIEAAGEAAVSHAAAALAGRGAAAAVMKGHVHTDALMAALLAPEAGIRTGRRLSHLFHMTVPDSERVLIITDAALNVAPDLKTKQAIVENAIDLCRALGLERPHIAVLSATETPSERMPSSLDAAALTRWAEERRLAARVFGPVAFDNIVSRDAALLKGIEHPVAGNADVVVVPNIECGNALFKMMVYFMSACAAGIVLGGRIPIMLTSRADPPAARLASAALAVLAARARAG